MTLALSTVCKEPVTFEQVMTMETHIPCAALQPYIKVFHVVESNGLPLENRVLPDTVIALERFLLAKLRPHEPDPAAVRAVAAICYAKGRLPIAELASGMCLSQDAFEKRFRRAVGISPKSFANTVRLKALINAYQPKRSLQHLALQGDYFDQAHFNRAFKRFTGLPPGQFFSQPHFW